MKKWIAIVLSAVMLLGILAGCKQQEQVQAQEEYEITPDDKMTIAICALARSVNALKAGNTAIPVRYTVENVRTLDGVKTVESNASYDNEKLLAVVESRYYEGETLTGSESFYTFVKEDGGKYSVISAEIRVEGDKTTKEYRVLYTGDTLLDVENAWTTNRYGADMAYQTYGRLEKLIVSAALSEGGAEANVTGMSNFTLSISTSNKTESYTVENNLITKLVWTEWTANGEDEGVWTYQYDVAEATLPDLSDGWTLVTEE